MDRKKSDQVIYLKDLLFVALRHWRGILAVALIAAVLLGGVTAVTEVLDHSDADVQYKEAYTEYKLNLDVLTAKENMLKRTLSDQQAYLDNSIYMNLDPYEFYEASLCLYVDTGYQIIPDQFYQDPDKTAAVLAAYETSFYSKDSARLLADTLNTQTQFASELIACTTAISSGTITVSVRCVAKEQAEAVLTALTTQLDTICAEVSKTVIPHTFSVLSKGVACKADTNIAIKRAELSDNVTALQKALTDTQALLATQIVPQYTPKSRISTIKQILLFAVIGGIVGFALGICGFWVLHIISDRVYSARTLRDRTGIKILGCLQSIPLKCSIDRWINKKEGRCTNDLSGQAAFLAATIRNRCCSAEKILVTGSICAEQQTALTLALQAAIPEKQFSGAESLRTCVEAQAALFDCDTVILVAQCGKSAYSTLSAEAELVHEQGKSLTGCIVLDG